MPPKPLQLPSPCMYIVNVPPSHFIVPISRKVQISSLAIWGIGDPKIPVSIRSPILFSTLVVRWGFIVGVTNVNV